MCLTISCIFTCRYRHIIISRHMCRWDFSFAPKHGTLHSLHIESHLLFCCPLTEKIPLEQLSIHFLPPSVSWRYLQTTHCHGILLSVLMIFSLQEVALPIHGLHLMWKTTKVSVVVLGKPSVSYPAQVNSENHHCLAEKAIVRARLYTCLEK